MALDRDPAHRWDNIPDDAGPTLRAYATEYLAPPELAPLTGRLCDEVWARSWREAQTICDARRPGIEIVLGRLVAEYSYYGCEECGERHGKDYEGDPPAFDHAPTCSRRFTLGSPAIPEGM